MEKHFETHNVYKKKKGESITMKKYLSEYTKDSMFERHLNHALMNKSADPPLVEFVKESWKSLEVVPSIKIMGFEYTEEESAIDINNHIFKRDKKRKKNEKFDYKYVDDDRYGKLTTHIQITVKEKDTKTGETFEHVYPFTKAMLIPLQDKNGYLHIKGKKYYMIYQMVEKSTYTSSQSVTLKSLMPIAVKRQSAEIAPIETETPVEIQAAADTILQADPDAEARKTETYIADVLGKHYHVPVYYIFVFKKEIPVLLFYMSKGIDLALNELQVAQVIHPLESYPETPNPDCIYFKISGRCYLEVVRWAFEKYPYVQSVVGGIMIVTNLRTTLDQLGDGKQWVKRIANPPNYEKGAETLKFFNRLLDQTTARILKLYQYHKKDIYTLLRWICQEYNTLRLKDNLSLDNKRLRCMETVSSLLTIEFSKRLNRIISLGERATIENYKELFKWPGNLLITKLFQSGLLSFDDSVNDLNFFKKFKYTTKGPQSLGNKNGNNVGARYRTIHPSFIGNIDVLVCGNSDPGRNGVLSPWGPIEGLYFDDSMEVGNYLWNMQNDLRTYYETGTGEMYVYLDTPTEEAFYDQMLKIQTQNEGMNGYGVSLDGDFDVVVETEDYFNDDHGIQPKEKEKELTSSKKIKQA